MIRNEFLPLLNPELSKQEQREVFMFNYDLCMTIASASKDEKTIAEFTKELFDSVDSWKNLKDENCTFETKVVRARFKLFVNRLIDYARYYDISTDEKLSVLAEKLRTQLEEILDKNPEWLYFGRSVL